MDSVSDPNGAPRLTKQQAADRIGVTTKTIERLTADGKLHPTRWRRPTGGPELVVYDPDEVDRIAQARQPGPAAPILVPVTKALPTNGNGRPSSGTDEAPARVPAPVSSQLPAIGSGEEFFRVLVAAAGRVLSETSQTPTLYLTIAEAAAVSGLSRAYVTRACEAGTLKAIRDGRRWRIRRTDLEAL